MSVGSLIKLNRIRKQWNQDELAHGIISTSYLSKIENNQVEPSPEIMELLFERLGITPYPQSKKETSNTLKELSEHLVRRNVKQSEELIRVINATENSTKKNTLFTILQIRYYLLIQDYEKCETLINNLQPNLKDFSTKESYYYFKHWGDYEVKMHAIQSAVKKYEEALKYFNKLTLSTLEKAHFYYSIAFGYSKNLQNSNVFQYIGLALPLYQSQYELNHCADCHIILGISYQRQEHYQKAIEAYEKARELSSLVNYKDLLGTIETNLGTVYFRQGNFEKGLEHYNKSIELKKGDVSRTIVTIYSIVRECAKMSQLEHAKEWLNKGLQIVNQDNPSQRPYYYLLMIYNFVLNDFPDDFEQDVKNIIIPYFEKIQDVSVLCFILSTLGEFFYNKKNINNPHTILNTLIDIIMQVTHKFFRRIENETDRNKTPIIYFEYYCKCNFFRYGTVHSSAASTFHVKSRRPNCNDKD
ncbi:hypothetical protein Q73_15335 [Bacillus coahuilensis m2-6]|uniref:tetratricopeptide repeat protein n=1 Tax=Bacillus coahuilensis TaxID=408580 RepID=UPI0007501AEA|nr:tetratricopeptide repeat protein [Bacillus coahuilensis]KUP04501.1 hypothetical protein Q73_15335 [Bacillus coahuilensis m2-6]